MKTIIAVAVSIVPAVAQAHPGHSETFHAHPELYAVIAAVSVLVAVFSGKKKIA